MAEQFNQWGTVTFEVPDFLESTRDKINTTAEFLVAVLDIALTALDFVKTFLVGYLDPIAAIVHAIVQEVRSLISDLRQLGIYITGDWKLLEWPYDDLQGGFQEYQRRMIARLTDITDPTRPNVSANTKVLSMFFYLSVDVSEIQQLILFVKKLMRFFNQSVTDKGSQPTAVLSSVKYGTDAVDITHPKSLTELYHLSSVPPGVAKFTWSLSSTAQKNPSNPLPPLPPGGFIVTVSTVEDGLKVMYDAPKSDTSLDPSAKDPTLVVQPRDYGHVRSHDLGTPMILYGGADMIPEDNLIPVNLGYAMSLDKNGNVSNGVTRIYAQKVSGDDGIIPLEYLTAKDSNGKLRHLMQRTFYVPSTEKWASWASGEYGYVMKAEDMPYNCTWETGTDGQILPKNIEIATTAYVRVAAISKEAYAQKVTYTFESPDAKGGKPYVEADPFGLEDTMIGAWSRPIRVAFPGANTKAYLDALKTALLVLVLVRPDLDVYDPNDASYSQMQKQMIAKGTLVLDQKAMERCGLESMAYLASLVLDDYRKTIEQVDGPGNPQVFRKNLMTSIDRVAHNIYNMTGANAQLEKIVVDQTQYLRKVTWQDIFKDTHTGKALPQGTVETPIGFDTATLIQSIDPSTWAGGHPDSGIASNIYSMGIKEDIVQEWFYVPDLIQNRKPQMMEMSNGGLGLGVSDKMTIPAAEVAGFLATLTKGMRLFYERWIDADTGDIVVPIDFSRPLEVLATRRRITGSADLSPVFFLNNGLLTTIDSSEPFNPSVNAGIFYCRGLLTEANGGQLMHETELALSIAASAIRKKKGDWIALRLLDIFPSLDDFFSTINNWLQALEKSIKSIVDTIKRYIEFIEGRIIELQGLIRRINSLLQNILGFAFQIPKCAFLTMVSNGTQGVVGDLVAAKLKPNDSPLAYGAGIAVVIPFGPALAMDIVQAMIKAQDGPPGPGKLALAKPAIPDAVGIEDLPPPPPPVGDTPPDTL